VGIEKGSRLGPYEIVGPLGAGGMGEVYRARDTRLGREVAIKALPEEFSRDPERLARFEREARLLASLQHANIAGIHGLEVVDGRRYLVLEYVEGETLAARVRRGAIPVDEAIDVARGIAAALDAAHEAGIVHRDLKPGNVMLTGTGEVKVLDFGLAKGREGAGSSSDPDLSASPTLTYAGTQAGVILGTAAYMSPEQARGKAVDRRTDIWSFGCVVFECLTARQAFAGETVSDIVAHILQSEPAWSALPASTPERLRGLLRRCLEKDVKRRQRDIGDARIELEDLQALRESSRVALATSASRGPAGWAVVSFVAVAVAAVTWFGARMWSPAPSAPPSRFEVSGPRHRELSSDQVGTSLSPDGQWLAMIAADSSGTPSIWLRKMDSLTPRELPGTTNATLMFWSPDSRFLGFFAGDQVLSKIAIAGGDPERICEVKSARGGTWNRDGVILFAPYSNGGIYRVSANGGEPVAVTHPDSAHGENGNRFPDFLPDGKHFVFSSVPAGADGKFGLYVGSLDGGTPRPLMRVETGAIYCDPGWLLTTRNNALVAQRFDVGALRLVGEPITLGDGPSGSQFSGGPYLTASSTGVLAFPTRTIPTFRLVWMDLAGHEVGTTPVPSGPYGRVSLSPDGRRVLLAGTADDLTSYVALADLERGTVSRISLPGENAGLMAWSPDGRRVAYLDQTREVVVIRSLADGTTRSLLTSDHTYKRLGLWSHDGRYLVIERLDAKNKWDSWLLPVEGDSTLLPAACSPANDTAPLLSPDGRWLAFICDESGIPEVYVQAVGSAGLKYQVTSGGGVPYYFSRDGRNLFYVRADPVVVIYRAAVQAADEFSLGPSTRFGLQPEDISWFDFGLDEKRLLALRATEKPARQTITVLQNWQAALRKP
jgi:serine/threonine protein kinase